MAKRFCEEEEIIMKKSIITLFVTVIIITGLAVSNFAVIYKSGDRLRVLSSSLAFRDNPSFKGKLNWVIPYGHKIKVVRKTGKVLTIEGIRGQWVEVIHQGQKGFVFDGYLSQLPAPPFKCESYRQYGEKKLGKIGRVKTTVVRGHMDDKDPSKNKYPYEGKNLQKFGRNAWIESHFIYDPQGIEVTITRFYLDKVSLEEGFLIARHCGSQGMTGAKGLINPFKDMPFKKNIRGEVILTGNDEEITIKKQKSGVLIKFRRSL